MSNNSPNTKTVPLTCLQSQRAVTNQHLNSSTISTKKSQYYHNSYRARTKGAQTEKCPREQWVISVFTAGFPQLPRITRTFGIGTGLSPRPIIITMVSFSWKKSPCKMGTTRAGKLSEDNSVHWRSSRGDKTIMACLISSFALLLKNTFKYCCVRPEGDIKKKKNAWSRYSRKIPEPKWLAI